jgi:hypothetical protein
MDQNFETLEKLAFPNEKMIIWGTQLKPKKKWVFFKFSISRK